MCRNIKTLYNFEPPVTEDEIHAASLQYVRKISGFNKPSQANEAAFLAAVDAIAAVAHQFLSALETNAPPKNRAEEAAKARARSAQRFPNQSLRTPVTSIDRWRKRTAHVVWDITIRCQLPPRCPKGQLTAFRRNSVITRYIFTNTGWMAIATATAGANATAVTLGRL